MRRSLGADLPKGVFRVKRLYYYQHRRGRPDHGPCIRLPEFGTPEFWAKMAEIQGVSGGNVEGTFSALIAEYKAHSRFLGRSEATQKTYEISLNYIQECWGPLRVDGLTPRAIQEFLDQHFAHRPSMGNMTLTVLKVLLRFGIPRSYSTQNHAREIEHLEERGDGAKPWPEEIWRRFVDAAPADLARLAVLGRATGQRISDLVRMRGKDRDGAGIVLNIKKLRGKQHWVPVSQADLAVIDGWKVFPNATFLADERGRPFDPKKLRKRFDTYVREQFPGSGIKIHGLRCMAVCDRRILGHNHQRIVAAIGLSISQVMHYSRDIDQRLAAVAGEREQNVDVKTDAP